jgi:hypothetical protein
MVDKAKRVEAAKLIEDFLACRITNFQYMDQYPRSAGDPALFAIYSRLWSAYSDVREHRMDGKHALDDYGRAVAEQCILFLKTDNEYHGPRKLVNLSAPLKRVWYWLRRKSTPELIGPAWPFDDAEQLDAARNARPPVSN